MATCEPKELQGQPGRVEWLQEELPRTSSAAAGGASSGCQQHEYTPPPPSPRQSGRWPEAF
eukprot:4237756-Prorocentrum_lima.AAC.1